MIDAVIKSDKAVYVTAPVLVPGEKDCDYCRGETPLSVKQVRDFAHSLSNYGFIEKDHDVLVTKQTVGKPVESYLTPIPVTLKAVDGSINKYPVGTWFVKSKITDEATQERVLKGELNGYSITALPRDLADKYKDILESSMKQSEGKLIKDLNDPVGFAISLVPVPCVGSAKICNVSKKGEKMPEDEKLTEKGIMDIVKKSLKDFGFKPKEEPEYVTKDELESAFKAHTEAIEEVLSEKVSQFDEIVTKAKKKEEEEDEGSSTTEEEEEEGGTASSNNEEEEEEDDEDKKKKGSSKGLKVGNHTPENSMKSTTEIVMKSMKRDISGSRVTKID